MRTTPSSFFSVFVEPDYWDYRNCPDDVRLGFNSAVSAFQLADIFHAYYSHSAPQNLSSWTTLKSLHVHLSQIEPCFLIIQSVATVYKHLYAKGGHYLVGSPGGVYRVAIPERGFELAGEWSPEHSDLLVKTKDGSTVSMTNTLQRVVEHMWPKFLAEHDVDSQI